MNNQLATTNQPALDREQYEVLQATLYPGARFEDIALVVGACRAQGLDPMSKPFHIIPMRAQVNGQWVERPQIMPGIDLYRTKASRTGEYVGKSEPEFGPMIEKRLGNATVTFPDFCRVTVRRLVAGKVCDFSAVEYWEENYATKSRNDASPNSMWAKRPRGQLAKCAEAQALRMAFPDAVGAQPTYEEMQGKDVHQDDVIETVVTQKREEPRPANTNADDALADKIAGGVDGSVEPAGEDAPSSEPIDESSPSSGSDVSEEQRKSVLNGFIARIKELESVAEADELASMIADSVLTPEEKTGLRSIFKPKRDFLKQHNIEG